MECGMQTTGLAKGIGVALATEVCADVAILGAVKASRGNAPWRLVAIAGGLAIAGAALLVRMLPAIEDEVVCLAADALASGDCCCGDDCCCSDGCDCADGTGDGACACGA